MKKKLTAGYFANGGDLSLPEKTNLGLSSAVSFGGELGGGLIDAFGKSNTKVGGALSQGMSLAGKGMAVAGPWGAAVGGAIGLATGWIGAGKRQEALRRQQGVQREQEQRISLEQGQAAVAADQSLVYGRRGSQYFANGGQMKPLNSSTVEVQGNTHEQGGVHIPGAEVENGETITKGFVFSDKLGFSKEHKVLAKAIGNAEKRVANPVNIKTVELLQKKEQALALKQEFYKQQQGLPSELDNV